MGVFTVGRQVALEIDMPGWWLANASVDMDFRRGLYYDSSTANPRAATDFLSCVRASVGYAKTAEGTLTSFASNALRITSGGLLVEDARTNVAVWSQELDHGGWNIVGQTITADATTAPDGTTTADKCVPTASQPVNYQSVTGSVAQTTWTAYFKNAGFNYGCLSAVEGSNRYCILVNLTTGAVETTNTVGTPSVTSSSVETLANGWYRLQITLNAASGSQFILLAQSDTASPTFANNTPNNVTPSGSNGVYIWGAQVELGAFPSSYIPTTGAAATRAADAVTVIGNLNTLLTALPQSAVFDVQRISSPDALDFQVIMMDPDSVPGIFSRNTANTGGWDLFGTSVNFTLGGSLTWSGGAKTGFARDSGNVSVVGGGGTVGTGATAQTAFSASAVLGGNGGSSPIPVGLMRRATFWNTRLADATLQTLTV